jgi:transmembrane sensor
MSTQEDAVRAIVGQEAADWFVGNRAGLTHKERQSFTDWLKTSPMHVEEYLAIAVIAGDLRAACEDPAEGLDELIARARIELDSPVRSIWRRLGPNSGGGAAVRWRAVVVALACCVVGGIGLQAWWTMRPKEPPATSQPAIRFDTGHGDQQTRRLADNSVMHLNTDSAVSIRYGEHGRIITLTAGEAEFEVVHDPVRAFRVFAGPAEIVAIGTKFDVRLENGYTYVTVVQGRVAVGPSRPTAEAIPGSQLDNRPGFMQLVADQQTRVAEGQPPSAPVAVNADRTTAWLHRQIAFEHEPLERVASEFNRYVTKPFEITSPALRRLEISGVFATDDSEAFIAFLRSLNGVHVEITATRIRVSQE